MKKITQKSLPLRLAHYGALTVAIAGIADASGQIVYTDITPDFNGGANTDYALDLNNDGTIDFQVAQVQNMGTYAGFTYMTNLLNLAPTAAANMGLADSSASGYFQYLFALNSGDVISSGQTTFINNSSSSGFMPLNFNYTLDINGMTQSGSNGNFLNVTDKFIGLRFDVSGQTYYGWARLDVNTDGTTWVVKDYAYNSAAGEPITAGQTTLGFGVNELYQIKIVALNRSIALYNLPEHTNYKLYSTSGQTVLMGKTESDSYVIEANTISNGVYVLELNDESTNGVVRKKIVL